MTLPRFSIREMLLLITIVALALPHLYRSAFSAQRINLTSKDVDALVATFEPKARMGGGSSHGGGNSREIQKSYVVPKSSADLFALKLKGAMEKHLRYSGWSQHGTGSISENGKTTHFSFDLSNGASECAIRCYILDRESKTDRIDGDVEYIQFLIVWLQVP